MTVQTHSRRTCALHAAPRAAHLPGAPLAEGLVVHEGEQRLQVRHALTAARRRRRAAHDPAALGAQRDGHLRARARSGGRRGGAHAHAAARAQQPPPEVAQPR